MRKVTRAFLDKHNACDPGVAYWEKLGTTDAIEILDACVRDGEIGYATWVINHIVTRKQGRQILLLTLPLLSLENAHQEVIDVMDETMTLIRKARSAKQGLLELAEKANKVFWGISPEQKDVVACDCRGALQFLAGEAEFILPFNSVNEQKKALEVAIQFLKGEV